MVGSGNVVLLLLLDQAHVLLRLHIRLIMGENFVQFICCIAEVFRRDVCVRHHEPCTLEVVRIFELEISLRHFLKSLSALVLLFLEEFAKGVDNERRNVLLVLSKQSFKLFLSHVQGFT